VLKPYCWRKKKFTRDSTVRRFGLEATLRKGVIAILEASVFREGVDNAFFNGLSK
jgi:hypothetical protein